MVVVVFVAIIVAAVVIITAAVAKLMFCFFRYSVFTHFDAALAAARAQRRW